MKQKELLENAQARLLKLEAQAKDAILQIMIKAPIDDAATETAFKEILADIEAAKSFIADAMNRASDADNGEEDYEE